MEGIEINGLTKRYDSELALDNVSFTIPLGYTCLIAGPNGSGKTTLLNILIGLTRRTAGSITIPKGRSLGCAFQDPRVYGNLTVSQNLALFSRLKKGKDRQWVKYLVDFLSLDRWNHFYASDLSTGNAKKLDLCLGLLDRPDILILDEPLSTLDAASRRSVISLLEGLKQGGTTIIITSHHIDAFSSLIDRFVILSKGKMVYNDALPDLGNEKLVVELIYENASQNRNITLQDASFLGDELRKIDIDQCSQITIRKFNYDHVYRNALEK